MNLNRNGKIARLPDRLSEELNRLGGQSVLSDSRPFASLRG
jgi:hypothetical protein